jgi:hypothetical protein
MNSRNVASQRCTTRLLVSFRPGEPTEIRTIFGLGIIDVHVTTNIIEASSVESEARAVAEHLKEI